MRGRGRRLPGRPRQHLCLAQVTRAGCRRGRDTRVAGAACVARDDRGGGAGQRRRENRSPVREAPRPGRDARATKKDVSAFGPLVQFRYQRELEPPDASRGVLARRHRAVRARARSHLHRPCAHCLVPTGFCERTGLGAPAPGEADAAIFLRRAEVLRRYRDEGGWLLGLSWQPDVRPAS